MSSANILVHARIAGLLATPLVLAIDDNTVRYVAGAFLIVHFIWMILAGSTKKPPLSERQRRELMAHYIDMGLALARTDDEREFALEFIEWKLNG